MDYTYTYLLANIVELVIWLALFIWRKDIRREMLIMSFYFGMAGVVLEFVYTIDWWHPLTITGTRVGIEDFLFGFWIGGIAAVIYEVVFRRHLRSMRKRPIIGNDHSLFLQLSLLGLLGSFIFMTSLVSGTNSFVASVVTLILLLMYMWYRRPDLIPESLASGVLIIVIGYPWFIAAELLTPGWVQVHWYFDKLSGITLLTAPLEDGVWGFLAGAYIGPLYEFLREKQLIRFPIKNGK